MHTVFGEECAYSMGEVCIQCVGGVHTVWGRCAYSMGEVCIQYGGGVHTVWGKCAYSMGEVCISMGGMHAVWGRCACSKYGGVHIAFFLGVSLAIEAAEAL